MNKLVDLLWGYALLFGGWLFAFFTALSIGALVLQGTTQIQVPEWMLLIFAVVITPPFIRSLPVIRVASRYVRSVEKIDDSSRAGGFRVRTALSQLEAFHRTVERASEGRLRTSVFAAFLVLHLRGLTQTIASPLNPARTLKEEIRENRRRKGLDVFDALASFVSRQASIENPNVVTSRSITTFVHAMDDTSSLGQRLTQILQQTSHGATGDRYGFLSTLHLMLYVHFLESLPVQTRSSARQALTALLLDEAALGWLGMRVVQVVVTRCTGQGETADQCAALLQPFLDDAQQALGAAKTDSERRRLRWDLRRELVQLGGISDAAAL